jgi:hypothetical protein
MLMLSSIGKKTKDEQNQLLYDSQEFEKKLNQKIEEERLETQIEELERELAKQLAE